MKKENRHRRRRQAEQRALILIVSVILVFSGSLLFYIRGQGVEQKNRIGNVDFQTTEPLGDRLYEDGSTIHVEPGQKLAKDPTITLGKNSAPAYLRARILFGGLGGLMREELEAGLSVCQGWVKNPRDGYYYYQYPVEAGEKIVFFNSLSIPEHWERRPEKICFCVEVEVDGAEISLVTAERNENKKISGWTKIA